MYPDTRAEWMTIGLLLVMDALVFGGAAGFLIVLDD